MDNKIQRLLYNVGRGDQACIVCQEPIMTARRQVLAHARSHFRAKPAKYGMKCDDCGLTLGERQGRRNAHLGSQNSCRISQDAKLCDAREEIRRLLREEYPYFAVDGELDLGLEGPKCMAADTQEGQANSDRNSPTRRSLEQNEQTPKGQGQMEIYGRGSRSITRDPSSGNDHMRRGHESSYYVLAGKTEGSVSALSLPLAGTPSNFTEDPYRQSPFTTNVECFSPAVWKRFCTVSGFPSHPRVPQVYWDVMLLPVQRAPRKGLWCSCGRGFMESRELMEHVTKWQGLSLQCDQCFNYFSLESTEDLGSHFQKFCLSGSWRVSRMFLFKIPIA